MSALRGGRLTQLLALACLALLVAVLAPKVLARPSAPEVVQPPIRVSIEGEVVSPGAYELEFGARVADLVELAGGLRSTAARALVQLAAPLTDGQSVQVPAVTASGGAERVSINSASLAQLESLPGVGPATAQKIADHRPYSRVDDLLRVPGIGPRKLEQLRPLVRP